MKKIFFIKMHIITKKPLLLPFTLLLAFSFTTIVLPDNIQEAYLFTARSLFQQERYQEALENYKKACRLGEISPEDTALMAICYTKLKKHSEASKLIEDALKEYSNVALLYLAAGILNFEKKDYNSAYSYFEKAYNIDKTLVQAKKGMASSLVNMGLENFNRDREKAELCFNMALEIDPYLVPAIQNKAVLEYEKGSIKEALKLINRALKIEPTNPKILELKYYIYFQIKDYKNQAKVLLRLVTLYPGNPEYWALIGRVYENLGENKKSVEAYENARLYNTSNPYPYYKLALNYLKNGQKERAIFIIREGIGKAIQLIGSLKLKAVSKLSGKNDLSPKDLKEVESIAKLIEEPNKILKDLLKLLREASGPEGYERELALLIKRYPHTVDLQVALGELYMEQKNFKRAIKIWQVILLKHSRNVEAYRGIAYCYEMLGDIKKAKISYKTALDLKPDDESIYRAIIRIYKKQNWLPELQKEWEERLYMDKRNPVLLKALAEVEKSLRMMEKAEKHLKRARSVEIENMEYEKRHENN